MKKRLLIISFSLMMFASTGLSAQPDNSLILANVSSSVILNDKDVIESLPATNTSAEDYNETANTSPDKTTRHTDEEIAQLRQLFLKAENHLKLKQDARYFLLADQLKDYPLYPYLQYQWLKKNLQHERQIKHYLEIHSYSRYAPILKRKWLHHLAKEKQWPLFIENFTASSDTKLNCHYHYAQLQTGNTRAGIEGAKRLWVVGKSQPQECNPLFDQLKQSKQLTQDLLWKRFDAALQNNKVSLAAYIKKLMPREHHTEAMLWIKLHNRPAHYLPQLLKTAHSTQSAAMFSHGISRLARKDITAAIELWDTNKNQFKLNKERSHKLEKKLAMELVFEGEDTAYDRLSKLTAPDKSSREWRIRAAISEQNWPNVITAIKALSKIEIEREKWQYWLARGYLETDEIEAAQGILTAVATNRSFYGYLAADKVDRLYQLSGNPIHVSTDEVHALKDSDAFRIAFEFMVLDRINDAKLQWWHAVRQLNKKEILVAAKLAQRWKWDEIAIFTVAKAKHWDDIELRFPLSYAEKIQKNSEKQNLNPAILYGLVRRESAFNEKAYSPAGARGLMQIMPGTGRLIAKKLNERWRGNNSLYNPDINIKYGSYYYQNLLSQFDGNYAIALAAYNAGPNRVKQWLPVSESLPADIWIETIPYKETREYVINVLAYALIYQQRVQSDELSMNELTQDVLPLAPDTKK